MLDEFNARAYKPQRFLSIPLEEEEKRVLSGWRSFDNAVRVATLDPVGELGQYVLNPQIFRDQVKNLVILMSDQAPRGNNHQSASFSSVFGVRELFFMVHQFLSPGFSLFQFRC